MVTVTLVAAVVVLAVMGIATVVVLVLGRRGDHRGASHVRNACGLHQGYPAADRFASPKNARHRSLRRTTSRSGFGGDLLSNSPKGLQFRFQRIQFSSEPPFANQGIRCIFIFRMSLPVCE